MNKFILIAVLFASSANAADLDYPSYPADTYVYNTPVPAPPPPARYTQHSIFSDKLRAYTDVLVIETVHQKCSSMLTMDHRYGFIPNKNYFLADFDTPTKERLIELAKLRASDWSKDVVLSKGLSLDQVLTESAWCRLAGMPMMYEAWEDLEFRSR